MKIHMIHPISITLRQLNRAETDMDPDFGEPVAPDEGEENPAYDEAVTLRAQVSYGQYKSLMIGTASPLEDSLGHLTFLRSDLDEEGIMPKKGDMITSIDGLTVEFYVVEARPQGHYKHWGLLYAFFSDRKQTI